MRSAITVLVLCLACATTATTAPSAHAATVPVAAVGSASSASASSNTSATDAGKHAGEIINSWGGALLLAVAGMMGIVALAQRNVGMAFTLALIVLVVGGFVFAPNNAKSLIEGIWQALA
jgi:hypothetical protein